MVVRCSRSRQRPCSRCMPVRRTLQMLSTILKALAWGHPGHVSTGREDGEGDDSRGTQETQVEGEEAV